MLKEEKATSKRLKMLKTAVKALINYQINKKQKMKMKKTEVFCLLSFGEDLR